MLSHYRDQDFYCSFTQLPGTGREVNLDELPYTIHSIYSINRLRSSRRPTWLQKGTYPRRESTAESIDSRTSFPFTEQLTDHETTEGYPPCGFSKTATSTGTSNSSKRRKRLLAAPPFLANMIPHKRRKEAHPLLLQTQRKPSTLDFRCVGPEEDVGDELVRRISSLNLDMFGGPGKIKTTPKGNITTWMNETSTPAYPDTPRLDWQEPKVNDDWNSNWFSDID